MIQPVSRRPGFRHTSLSRRSPASGLTAESKLALDRTAKFRRHPIKAAQAESGAARGSAGSLGGSSRADRDRWFRPNEPGSPLSDLDSYSTCFGLASQASALTTVLALR